MIRASAVAGQFYSADPQQLKQQVETFLSGAETRHEAIGVILPHAGYVYSGSVAGRVLAETMIPRQVILCGPNHRGAGAPAAVSGASAWASPLGDVPVASELRDRLLDTIEPLQVDDLAHQFEHSLEVMLPFLQLSRPGVEIVPLALGHLSLKQCLQLGCELGRALVDWDQPVLLLASSDMHHFSSAEVTERLDAEAIERMTTFDIEGLYRTVQEQQISMCGVLPAVVVMTAARELGASRCRLVDYSHSGRVNGDYSSVVGYAGLSIE